MNIRHNIRLTYLIDGLVLALLLGLLTALIWFNLTDVSAKITGNLQDSTVQIERTQVLFSQQQELDQRIVAQHQTFDHLLGGLDALNAFPDTAPINPQNIHTLGTTLSVQAELLLQTWPDTVLPPLKHDYQQAVASITQQTQTLYNASVAEWQARAQALHQRLQHIHPIILQVDAVDEQLGMLARQALQVSTQSNKQNISNMHASLGSIKQGILWGTLAIITALLLSRLYFSIRFQHMTLTAREAQAIAEEALQTKARFLATMSHEIRTPMNGVIGMTRLLMNTPMSKKQSEFVDSIHLSGEHLLTVINDVLDFSKLEAGKLDLKREPLELRACIEDVLQPADLQSTGKKPRTGLRRWPRHPTVH